LLCSVVFAILSACCCVLDVAGCYWGTEKYFRTDFGKKNPGVIINGNVGFMSPNSDSPKNPSYKEVCTGETGHVEVYKFEFVGDSRTYEQLVKYFFQFHDPTTFNKQGNDKGTQYASAIFCYDELQMSIAKKVIAELQEHMDEQRLPPKTYSSVKITTAVRLQKDCSDFFPAHEEHQKYLEANPKGYCNHRIRIKEWPSAETAVTAPAAVPDGSIESRA
jgi:peptide-methionine (S)-S-oxide reductase